MLNTSFEPGLFDYDDATATILGLPKFDPALGTLTDVVFDAQWSFNTDLFIEAQGILEPGVPHTAIASVQEMGVGVNFMRSDGGSGGSMVFEQDIGAACDGEPGDGDGVSDATDNCTVVANADQIDSDGDGDAIGNNCDFDFNNDCTSNFLDFAALANAFGPVIGSEELDVNSDGAINFIDISQSASYHLQPPGPSATGCN